MNWREFANSLADERTQTIEITNVGVVRSVGERECLPVNAVNVDSGEEYEGLLIPTEAEIEFDATNFQLAGGRLSTSGKSYSNPGFDWKITAADSTMTSVKELEKAAQIKK